MFIAALFINAKMWKHPTCPPTGIMDKENVGYPYKAFFSHRRFEILIYATTWMNLENMHNERRQAQKATYHHMKCPKLAVHRNRNYTSISK